MKETTVQIDGMMSIFDDAGVEKQIKRRDGVVKVDANFLSGSATIVYDETRVAPDDIKTFIAECGYHCRGEVVPAHVCESGTPNRMPTVGAMEHQGHAVPLSPAPSAVKPAEEKIKAEAPPTTVFGGEPSVVRERLGRSNMHRGRDAKLWRRAAGACSWNHLNMKSIIIAMTPAPIRTAGAMPDPVT
jgi:copper chaperone CopZ